jgi:hypothetical protein
VCRRARARGWPVALYICTNCRSTQHLSDSPSPGSCLAVLSVPVRTHIGARCPQCTRLVRATRAQRACRAPPASGSRFGMNSEATQRAVELAAADRDPANRAQLGRRRELGERSRPKKLPCRAAFEHEWTSRREPLPAGCQVLAGRPGVLHGRQATLKDEHPSPTPTAPNTPFSTP